jgi:hypothetical protein
MQRRLGCRGYFTACVPQNRGHRADVVHCCARSGGRTFRRDVRWVVPSQGRTPRVYWSGFFVMAVLMAITVAYRGWGAARRHVFRRHIRHDDVCVPTVGLPEDRREDLHHIVIQEPEIGTAMRNRHRRRTRQDRADLEHLLSPPRAIGRWPSRSHSALAGPCRRR